MSTGAAADLRGPAKVDRIVSLTDRLTDKVTMRTDSMVAQWMFTAQQS